MKAWHTFLSCFYRKTLTRQKLLTASTHTLERLKPKDQWCSKLYLDANQAENCAWADHLPCSSLPNTDFKNSPLKPPWWLSGKESACQRKTHGFHLPSGKIPQAAEQLKLVRHDCWACAPEPRSLNCWAQVLQLLRLACPRARAL